MPERYKGERGESGDRGIGGERGPKGDHGQHGSTGSTGATGPQGVPGRGIAGMFTVLLMAVILVGYGVVRNYNKQRIDTETSMCERVKGDRVDAARALTAIAKYYDGVIAAESVQQDVKDHAAAVQSLVFESANQMRSRIYKCPELIEDGEMIIDERLLREAQGGL